jgi:hypothetical protein
MEILSTPDLHIVLEAKRQRDGAMAYRVVTPPVAWSVAQDAHQRFEMSIATVAEQRYFMVRSDDDPRWEHLPRPVARFRTFTAKTYTPARVKAARDYAKANGYEGRSGGWIYTLGGTPVAHGWEAFASRVSTRNQGVRRILLGDKPDDEMWFAVPQIFESEMVVVS